MSRTIPVLADFRRIVVKVGSSLLVDAEAGRVKEAWLASLAADIAKLHAQGREILVVSSGAIALGRAVLRLPKGPLKLEDSQAAAAVGQIALARTWSEALGRHGIGAGQVLVTLGDTEERRRYPQRPQHHRQAPGMARRAGHQRERHGGDQRESATATTTGWPRASPLWRAPTCWCCCPTSTVSNDAPPGRNADAKLIPLVERITPQIEAAAGNAASELSRGGMVTKIEAAKIATTGGTHLVIADGRIESPLGAIATGGRCSWFLTPANPVTSRKKWIAGSLEPKGTLTIDAGAVAALRRGKSLLPAA